MDKFNNAPPSEPYYHLWGKHELSMEQQRNVLLNFLHERGLDTEFMEYLNRHGPINAQSEEREIKED